MLALFQASFLGFASIPDTECPSTEPAKPVWKDTFPPKDMLAPLMGRAPGLSSFQDISEWFDGALHSTRALTLAPAEHMRLSNLQRVFVFTRLKRENIQRTSLPPRSTPRRVRAQPTCQRCRVRPK